jgi:fluoroquinolone transport system permease protein
MPMVLSFLLTMIVLPLSGLVTIGWPFLLLAVFSAAPMAPIFALALASLSQNKVQGFALMKVSGFVLMPPLAAYFSESKWQLVLGFVPTYWPAKVLWMGGTTAFWFYLMAGLAYQLLCLGLLARRFERIMYR